MISNIHKWIRFKQNIKGSFILLIFVPTVLYLEIKIFLIVSGFFREGAQLVDILNSKINEKIKNR